MLKNKQRPSSGQKFIQKPTAHLAQTMSLLGMTASELRQRVESELASNPALEMAEEKFCPTCNRPIVDRGPCPFCTWDHHPSTDDPLVFVSTRSDFNASGNFPAEDSPDDNLMPSKEDLPEFVFRQIASEMEPRHQKIAAHILSSLDDDGLLSVPMIEIASYFHIPLSAVGKVLRTIQLAEPVGVGSPNSKEALLIQLEVLRERTRVPSLAEKAISEGMSLLSSHQYSELGRLLGVSKNKAVQIARFIGDNLNPFPGRAHWGDIRSRKGSDADIFRYPDVIITLLNQDNPDSPFVIEVLLPISGRLQINPLFRQALQDAPSSKERQWKSDYERASLLVKCLRQRNHTMIRLVRRLAIVQRRFILDGDANLIAVTRASFAKELDVHESTISRAVSNKTLQLPNGKIIPIAKFFDRSLPVRTALKEIIESEEKPLSDSKVAELLEQRGYRVARRTVAKYRTMEGILPAYLRAKPPH